MNYLTFPACLGIALAKADLSRRSFSEGGKSKGWAISRERENLHIALSFSVEVV
jgi:hypothetical protein